MIQPRVEGVISFLFLGGAKRVAMAQMFKDACRRRGYEARIVSYELDSKVAIAREGSVVTGVRWGDKDIYTDIDRVVRKENIDILVPFVDGAVGIAANYCRREDCCAAFAPVGLPQTAEAMFDKVVAAGIFESNDVPVPRTYRPGDDEKCLIAKPRFGSASKGILQIDSARDMDSIREVLDNYLVQERIDRREEITVDCYIGVVSGEIVAVSPRVRCEVSGGEVVRTRTFWDAQVDAIVRKAINAAKLRGAVTVQLIRDLATGRLMVMEVNPRLGGGAVASVHARVDLPGLIIDDALGNVLAHQHAVPGVETVRYLADVVFYPEDNEDR